MAQSVNVAVLVGRLGAKPERVPMPDGTMLVRARLATNESWTDRASGEAKQRTDWHRLVARDAVGDRLVEFADKGSQVYVRGRQRPTTYTDRKQVEQTVVDIEVFDVRFLSSNAAAREEPQNEKPRRPRTQTAPAPATQAPVGAESSPARPAALRLRSAVGQPQPSATAAPASSAPAAPAEPSLGETIEFEGEF